MSDDLRTKATEANGQEKQDESDLIRMRREKIAKIEELGFDPYPSYYEIKQTITDIAELYGSHSKEKLEEEAIQIKTAGRITSRRVMGKTTFIDLTDGKKKIQIYVRKGELDEKRLLLFDLLDIGDFIGVQGQLFKTKTGELTIMVESLAFLSKGIRPLPEKFHGLQDVEQRYRQRYLDLVMNPEVRATFEIRSRTITWMRRLLNARGFLEVETPMMQPIAGGAAARPFITHHNALNVDLYLRIAPELYLKRLVVGGMEKVYEINRSFRNEGISTRHNPEFTMLEFYQAYIDYRRMMKLIESILMEIVERVKGDLIFPFGEAQIDFHTPWPRIAYHEAICKKCSAIPDDLKNRDSVIAIAKKNNIEFDPAWPVYKIVNELFEKMVEPSLTNPTFITDYPMEMSPLSKKKKDNPTLVDRFELFIGGLEVSNGFSELNDPADQRSRFEQQLKARAEGDEEAHVMDEDYITAMEFGMPPIAGAGIGIDRLVMLLTNNESIREIILFPQLRPKRKP